MTKVRKRGEEVRRFILENVSKHERDLPAVVQAKFGITRQGAHHHIQKMVEQKAIVVGGSHNRDRVYRLGPETPWSRSYELAGLEEYEVFEHGVGEQLADLPENVRRLWAVGVTEMVNNAIDHSEGTRARVFLQRTATDCTVHVHDDGVGIFRKIQQALDLNSQEEAFLELAKGKFTTDPDRHTGEGIFFVSRMFDLYTIWSGGVFWGHQFSYPKNDFLLESDESLDHGTMVGMRLSNHTARTTKEIYDLFTASNEEDDHRFSKTIVPIELAKYGDEFLVSRSRAKRVLARVDKFQQAILDFSNVETIGQAFADEIFRVFRRMHPEVDLVVANANEAVGGMIARAKSAD